MNKEYAGAQPQMRNTRIESAEGYLGPYSPTLSVGDYQSMVFTDGDDGPFWLSPELRLKKKHDKDTGETKEGDKTKAELAKDLEAAGVSLQRGKHHSKLELHISALREEQLTIAHLATCRQRWMVRKAKGTASSSVGARFNRRNKTFCVHT